MNEYTGLAKDIIGAIGDERSRLGDFHTPHEAYAVLKQQAEEAEKAAGNIKKTLDELWKATKTRDEDSVSAYSHQLECDSRNATVSFAQLAAAAGNAK